MADGARLEICAETLIGRPTTPKDQRRHRPRIVRRYLLINQDISSQIRSSQAGEFFFMLRNGLLTPLLLQQITHVDVQQTQEYRRLSSICRNISTSLMIQNQRGPSSEECTQIESTVEIPEARTLIPCSNKIHSILPESRSPYMCAVDFLDLYHDDSKCILNKRPTVLFEQRERRGRAFYHIFTLALYAAVATSSLVSIHLITDHLHES